MLKRTPKSKRPSPRAASGKKQKSILSFFQSANRNSAGLSSSPAQRTPESLPNPKQTPSTAASLDRESPTAQTPAKTRDGPDDLRRELFAEPGNEALTPRPGKRRRLIKLEDLADDESDDDMPLVKAHPSTGNTPADVGMSTSCGADREADRAREAAGYDFSALQYGNVAGSGNTSGVGDFSRAESKARREARRKLGALDTDTKVGNEEGGWCGKHPWTVDIRDAKMRLPTDPDYDKTTLYVPPSELAVGHRSTKAGGLSPFQRQFWSIKKANYDVIIFFKKGKFYELYDVDADVGHRHLGLNFTKGGRVDMRCCGVPEQSFEKHCARLIDLGYKVGRVEQTETANAAEKRKNSYGGSKSSVCERTLVRILTKATVTDDGLLRDHRARYVFAVTEKEPMSKVCDSDQSTSVEDGGAGAEETGFRSFGVCYVDVASGSISIGQYDDDFRLAKTERLVTFLRPQEIIVNLSRASQRLSNIVKWAVNKGDAEIVDAGRRNGFSKMTSKWLAKYFDSGPGKQDEFSRVLQHLEKYSMSCTAFGLMASHLKSLIIDQEILSLGNYTLFPESERMQNSKEVVDESKLPLPCPTRLRMDAPTLENLEVLASSVDASERGALLSFIDRAASPAGRRLLRKWVAEPLVSANDIEDRLRAVEDIHGLEDEDGGQTLDGILKQFKSKKDLERALPKLHQQAISDNSVVMFDDTNKRKVREFLNVLRSLQGCLNGLASLREATESRLLGSKRLQWLFTVGCGVPAEAEKKLEYFLGDAFDLEAAENSGEILPMPGAVPSYDACRNALDEVEDKLNTELEVWKKKLGDPSIKFYHRGKEPFQIEVRLQTLSGQTPHEFEVCSESKNVKRFYTRKVKSLVRAQVEASEAYEEASSSVARDMMSQFDKEYSTWSAVSSACAEVDALIGLAYASRDNGSGPMCRPKILPNDHPSPVFTAEALRHPILASKSESFVSNDVRMGGGQDPEIMVLTGPNAGGKSTLARQVALSVILAQVGCFVPAKSFVIRPFEDIFVRMGASDDLARGRSTFMVEMEEVGNILNNATSRSLIIADEVGRGTSTHDGYAVAYASLDYISRVNKSITIFSTHYSHLGDDIVALGNKDGRVSAGLFEMGALVNEVSKKITFLFKVQPGSSGDSRGIYCARVAGIPENIAETAERASTRFDETLALRLEATKFCALSKGLALDREQAQLALYQR